MELFLNEENWKNAIVADRLPWVNISNLEGWDAVSEDYAVEAIPQNFLLDTAGIIIYKNLLIYLIRSRFLMKITAPAPAKYGGSRLRNTALNYIYSLKKNIRCYGRDYKYIKNTNQSFLLEFWNQDWYIR